MSPKSSTEIQSQIDKVNAESVNYIGKLEQDLATAKTQRLTERYQQELQTQITQARASYDAVLNRLEGDLSNARESEIRTAAEKRAEQERSAAETKELIKAELKAKWIEVNGDLDIFEAQFPQLYAEEIARRAVDKMIIQDSRGQASIINRSF